MKKSKNQLSILLFLSLFFVLTNCEKEAVVNQNFKAQHTNFKVSHVEELEISQNKQLSEKLNTFVEIIERGKLEKSGRLIFSEVNNFYIETDYATYIQDFDANSHSYTFPITRIGEPNGIENLLIVSQQDGSYKTFLIEYDFTPQEVLDIENEVYVDITNKINMYSLNEETLLNDIFNKFVVEEECIAILMCPWGSNGGEAHPAGQECIDANRTGADALYYTFSGNCTGSGGGISNPNPTDTSNGPNYGGNTTVSNTSVTTLSPRQKRNKDFKIKLRQLNLNQCENVDNNLTNEDWEELDNYLESEALLVDPYGLLIEYPENAQSFAISAIEAICEDGEVDIEDRRINGIKLDSNLPTCVEVMIIDMMIGNPNLILDPSYAGNTDLIEKTFESFGPTFNDSELDIVVTYKVEDIFGNGETLVSFDPSSLTVNIVVKIDEDLVNNGTKLAIAKTILHESVHAYLLKLQQEFPVFFATNSEFSQLVSDYQLYSNDNDPQHIFMSNLIGDFAVNISSFLSQEYDYPTNASSAVNDDLDYYEAVCWSGLTHLTGGELNPVFLNNYPNSGDRDDIIKIFQTENGSSVHENYLPLIDNNCN